MSIEDTVQEMIDTALGDAGCSDRVTELVDAAIAEAIEVQGEALTTEDVEAMATDIAHDVLSDYDPSDHIDIDSGVENALCNICLSDYLDIDSEVYSAITNFIYEGCGEMDEAGAHIIYRGVRGLNSKNEWRILSRNEYNQVVDALAKFNDGNIGNDTTELECELQELRDLNAGAQLDIGELQDQVNALLQVINVPDQTPPTDEEVVEQTVNHFGTPQAFNAKVLEMAEAVRAPLMALTKADLVGLAANTGVAIDQWGRKADIIDALIEAGVDIN